MVYDGRIWQKSYRPGTFVWFLLCLILAAIGCAFLFVPNAYRPRDMSLEIALDQQMPGQSLNILTWPPPWIKVNMTLAALLDAFQSRTLFDCEPRENISNSIECEFYIRSSPKSYCGNLYKVDSEFDSGKLITITGHRSIVCK